MILNTGKKHIRDKLSKSILNMQKNKQTYVFFKMPKTINKQGLRFSPGKASEKKPKEGSQVALPSMAAQPKAVLS